MSIRELDCDHITENPKLHPKYNYLCIGNTIFAMCLTCYNAVKGQVYEGETKRLLQNFAEFREEDE